MSGDIGAVASSGFQFGACKIQFFFQVDFGMDVDLIASSTGERCHKNDSSL